MDNKSQIRCWRRTDDRDSERIKVISVMKKKRLKITKDIDKEPVKGLKS